VGEKGKGIEKTRKKEVIIKLAKQERNKNEPPPTVVAGKFRGFTSCPVRVKH
jgi:hypothetical protein